MSQSHGFSHSAPDCKIFIYIMEDVDVSTLPKLKLKTIVCLCTIQEIIPRTGLFDFETTCKHVYCIHKRNTL